MAEYELENKIDSRNWKPHQNYVLIDELGNREVNQIAGLCGKICCLFLCMLCDRESGW
jgi:hypothetical protein